MSEKKDLVAALAWAVKKFHEIYDNTSTYWSGIWEQELEEETHFFWSESFQPKEKHTHWGHCRRRRWRWPPSNFPQDLLQSLVKGQRTQSERFRLKA
jgi:hypothetical protein